MSAPGAWAVVVLSRWTLCCHCQSDNWWSELGLPRNPTSAEPFDLPSLGVEQSLEQEPLMEPGQWGCWRLAQPSSAAFDAHPVLQRSCYRSKQVGLGTSHVTQPRWEVPIWVLGLVTLGSQGCRSQFLETNALPTTRLCTQLVFMEHIQSQQGKVESERLY